MFITVNQNVIDEQSRNQNNTGESRKVWLRLADGEQVFIQAMLDPNSFIGYYRHAEKINNKWEYIHCTDPSTCPCCKRRMKRALRTLIPMVVSDDVKGTNRRVMVFDASVNDVKEFYLAKAETEEEGGNFIETIYKFKRVGEKLDTSYRLTATRGDADTFRGNLEVKMPDWDKLVKFPTPAEVEIILAGQGNTGASNFNLPQGAKDPFKTEDFIPEDDGDMPF